MELYTNLGHTSAVLDRNYKTVEFYSKALFWSKQTANKQQIGVTHYNLARSYQATEQLKRASDEFVNAKKMFEESDAIVAVYDTNLMLIEINQSLQNKEFVSQLIGEVQTALDENKLTHYQGKWFLTLNATNGLITLATTKLSVKPTTDPITFAKPYSRQQLTLQPALLQSLLAHC